jgi:Zn-finger nucleic acid-binding protein
MDCPRCKLALQRESYEGFQVEVCGTCWGVWLDPGELEQILLSKRYAFSTEEKDAALGGTSTGPTSPISCPQCSVRMERLYLDPAYYLVIDRCPSHGIWLDGGEIKKVQALADTSGEHCRNLIERIRRKPTVA